MHLWGIDWVGVDAENGRKLVLSLVFIAVVVLLRIGLRALVGRFAGGHTTPRPNSGSGRVRASASSPP